MNMSKSGDKTSKHSICEPVNSKDADIVGHSVNAKSVISTLNVCYSFNKLAFMENLFINPTSGYYD